MNNAVIYARFSDASQNAQTIDGQIRVCTQYAEKQGLSVVKVYDKDKAKSASKETEKRKDLHRMFADAESGAFQYIIVYKMDRFARNRNESRIFKSELAKHGVRVLSATENITDDEGGELYEMILEWNDEKYSQRLSKRIRDGLITSLTNGTYTGGACVHFGYKLTPTGKKGKKGDIHKVDIDEQQAEILRFAFTEYASGTAKKEIVEQINAQGHKYKGKSFNVRLFEKWFVNDKYTGEFERFDRVWDNVYPQIIDKALFEKVQERLKANQVMSGANSAVTPYILTGKANCMKCGTMIVSDGGTARDGTKKYYYACKKKKKNLCTKKRNHKDPIEKSVATFIVDCLSDPEIRHKAIDDCMKHHDQRTSDDGLKSIDTRLANANAEIEQLTNSFILAKNDLLRATIEKKMSEMETYLKDLNKEKAQIKIERGNKLTRQQVIEYVAELIKGDLDDKTFQKRMIDRFVVKVYIGDGDFFVTVNFFEMSKTEIISFDDVTENLSAKAVQSLTPILHQTLFLNRHARCAGSSECQGVIVRDERIGHVGALLEPQIFKGFFQVLDSPNVCSGDIEPNVDFVWRKTFPFRSTISKSFDIHVPVVSCIPSLVVCIVKTQLSLARHFVASFSKSTPICVGFG